ncbi:RusA family crossover junction endodeoxyribonuclease [Streptomyces halstedii]|uniref:RusA family crossover junction endodeoxyribonuclease n=1 Tax=Streptomyces halstedii TaxID=1944 RepID=UPI00335F2D59
MPIRAEDRDRYPADWDRISERIRTVRSGGRCECKGQCGRHRGRCRAWNGEPHPETRSRVVLTVAHLDRVPENCDEANLVAMCQACHLAYDAQQHAATRARTRHEQQTAGMTPLFDPDQTRQPSREAPGQAAAAPDPASPGAGSGASKPRAGEREGKPATGPGPGLVVTVLGEPVGQGAISYGRHGRGYHSNDKTLRPWRAKVAQAAADLTGQHPFTKPPKVRGQKDDRRVRPCTVCGLKPGEHGLYRGPLVVDIALTVPALKTVRRRWPTTRSSGDWDHLGRAISDALTGVLWPDDSQVIDGRVRKFYPGAAGALTEPGAVITITPIPEGTP